MFDLDTIEEDWIHHSFRLSEEDIIEIYREEGVTLSTYNNDLDKYRKNTHIEWNISAEERLFMSIFDDSMIKQVEEKEKLLRKQYEYPKRKYLSIDAQKRVVEGSLYLVFASTRKWYDFFDQNVSMENLYYICLEALMNSVKYILHCEKPVFELYVLKSIERNMIKYIARREHLTYREVYQVIHNHIEECNRCTEFTFDYEYQEIVEKPSKIFYQKSQEFYNVDYLRNISSEEFMCDYTKALATLDDMSKLIIQLSFDINGNRGLTNTEISDYLGLVPQKISNVRRNAIKTLKKDSKLKKYL